MKSGRHVCFLNTMLGLLMTVAAVWGQDRGGGTATGASNELNPAISLNALFLGAWRDPESDLDGLKAQEIEAAFTSVVDPYFKAEAYVAYEPDPEGPESEVALEEAFVLTTSLPAGWGVRAGRFFTPFGRHNHLHTHSFPFVEAPMAVRAILGEESAGDVGLEAAYAPVVPWYLNLIVHAGDGAVEGVFDGSSRDLAVGGRVENLWDLSEATTLDGGLSFWDGPAESDSRRTLYGIDIRLKYRDPRRTQGKIVECRASNPMLELQTGVWS